MVSTNEATRSPGKIGAIADKLGFKEPSLFSGTMPKDGVFAAAFLDPSRLEDAPIRSSWILDGEPVAKCETLSHTTRGWGSAAHWSCTAGTFRWEYGWDETVLFVEGEVYITDADGAMYHGRPGVSLRFPAGTTATWHVPRYIRKIAFNQKPVNWHVHKFARICERLGRVMGMKAPAGSGL